MWLSAAIVPDDAGFHEYIVTDGDYVTAACWDEKMGWYDNGDGWNAAALAPQPKWYMEPRDLLKSIPVP